MKTEIEALMCEAKVYFTNYLRLKVGDERLEVSVKNIEWTYNGDCETPINVLFSIDATHGDGSSASSDDIYQSLKLGDDDLLDLIQNYIIKSHPVEVNVFAHTNQLTFEGTMGSDITLPEGKIAEAICTVVKAPAPAPDGPSRIGTLTPLLAKPNKHCWNTHNCVAIASLATTPSSSTDSTKKASYQLAFGFYSGKAREPSMAELNAFICQTNQYVEKMLQDSTGDHQLVAHAVNIDSTYMIDCPSPVTVTFEIESKFGNGSSVPSHEVFQLLRLGDDELKTYLQEYVWNSQPSKENVFYSANQVSFDESLGVSLPAGKISVALCPEGGAPAPAHEPEPQRNGT